MIAGSGISGTLRRTLLIKVISKPQPSREDVRSVIELTSSKVVEGSSTFSVVHCGGDVEFTDGEVEHGD